MKKIVFFQRLSGKLLVLAILAVLVSEVVIFFPSAALYRQNWLQERTQAAGLLTLALTDVSDFERGELLSRQFTEDTDVILFSARREGKTDLLLGAPPALSNYTTINMNDEQMRFGMMDVINSMFGSNDGYIRILASSTVIDQDEIELIVPRRALNRDIQNYSRNILGLSLIIALITGLVIYLALSLMIVRPIEKLANGLSLFRESPEERGRDLFVSPSTRKDEIGDLEREFFTMKQGVRSSFKQRERLAALGMAVAKINHDLRNVLTTAQMISDRMAMDKEERVARMGERLVRAIGRGVKLCAETLSFSSSKEEEPEIQPVRIALLVGEAAGDVLGSFGAGPRKISFDNQVPSELVAYADPDHTYRIFHNLFRNAGQAMAAMKDDDVKRQLSVEAKITDDTVDCFITDTGPGLPENAKENLFKAFAGSGGQKGSTGLGLTISRELAESQGGTIDLSRTGPDGTTFMVSLRAHPLSA